MHIVISGGTGLIGRYLSEHFRQKNLSVTVLTRFPRNSNDGVRYLRWLVTDAQPEQELQNVDIWINLAGTSINAGRWGKNHQKQIYQSRMKATDEVLRITEALPKKPGVLINASAIGIYPARRDAIYTEKSQDVSYDFLGKTVTDWEKKALQAQNFGIRTVLMRFGVVLDRKAGALPLMVFPYRLFVGGTIGEGDQWVSWIHIVDVVRAIEFVIQNPDISGPVNVTAPNPVRMRDFGKTVANVLKRPHWLPVPAFVMRLLLGKKSQLVLEGQHVFPEVLLENGFHFQYPELHIALEDLFKSDKK